MSYSEFIKNQSNKDKDFFFGKDNWKKITNKYYEFKRVLNDDEIIIVTNNIKTIKNNLVLLVDNNKAVYLKDWQVRRCYNYNESIDAYLVKLNRKYFKTYTFTSNFDDYSFEKENTFDDLLQVAKEQQDENLSFKL
jgi:hypothetical protein